MLSFVVIVVYFIIRKYLEQIYNFIQKSTVTPLKHIIQNCYIKVILFYSLLTNWTLHDYSKKKKLSKECWTAEKIEENKRKERRLRKQKKRVALVMDWMFVFPSLYVVTLTPNVTVLGGRAFGRWLGNEDEAFTNGTRALIKEPLESFLTPSII